MEEESIPDPLCSGSVRSRIEGCDMYPTKKERDLCTDKLQLGCTDRPYKKPVELTPCQLCGVNNGCDKFQTVGLRDECLKKNCDSTGNCSGTFPDVTAAPSTNTSMARLSLLEAYKNPF